MRITYLHVRNRSIAILWSGDWARIRSRALDSESGTENDLTQIFHRKSRQRRDKDRKGPPYFRKPWRLGCSEFSGSTLVLSPVRAGTTGLSACSASFAVQMHCLGLMIRGEKRNETRGPSRDTEARVLGTLQARGPGSAEEVPTAVPRVPHLDLGDRVDAPGGGPGATDPGAAQVVIQQPAG